jgi:hypothetical protein
MADAGLLASDQAGDLRVAVLGFRKTGNLVSCNLVEVLVINQVTLTFRSSSIER